MRKTILCICAVLCVLLGGPAARAEELDERRYALAVSLDEGENPAAAGESVTVCLTLRRTDGGVDAPIYGMQTELCYDASTLTLEELTPLQGVRGSAPAPTGEEGSVYLSFVSLSGGDAWERKTAIARLRFRVTAQEGSAALQTRGSLVAKEDGSASYCVDEGSLSFAVSVPAPSPTALAEMTNPSAGADAATVDEEKSRTGIDPWLWGGAVVLLALLALLLKRPTVRFNSCGGSAVEGKKVILGATICPPAQPNKADATFLGWFTQAEGGTRWNFARDRVVRDVTLYAHWQEEGRE